MQLLCPGMHWLHSRRCLVHHSLSHNTSAASCPAKAVPTWRGTACSTKRVAGSKAASVLHLLNELLKIYSSQIAAALHAAILLRHHGTSKAHT